MIFKAKREYWYTPDIEGNLKLPPDQQLQGLIRRPDAETRNSLTCLEVQRDFSKNEVAEARKGKAEEEKPRKASVSFVRRQDTGRILRECVPSLRNCQVEIEEDGKKRIEKIASGEDLAASTAFGIRRLIELLCAEVLREELDEEAEKNSPPPSSST